VVKPASYSSPVSSPSLTFVLENTTDNVFTSMNAAQLRQFIIDARGPSHLSPSITTHIPPNFSPSVTAPQNNRLISFTSPPISSTPKMNRVRSSGSSGGLTTYFRPIDFLDNQRSFDYVFGTTPVMLRVSKWAAGTCEIEDTEYLEIKVTKILIVCYMIFILLFLT